MLVNKSVVIEFGGLLWSSINLVKIVGRGFQNLIQTLLCPELSKLKNQHI